MRLRVRCLPACSPLCRAALSLIARSLLPPQCHDVIAAAPVMTTMSSAAPSSIRYRPGISSRLGTYRPLFPFLIPCPHRCPPCLLRSVIVSPMSSSPSHPSVCFLIISASSSRHHACWSCPPRLTPRPCLSRNGEGLRVGCWLFGCRRLVCLAHAVSPPRAIWLSPISSRHLVRPCLLTCADGGGVWSRAVALLASPLERFNHF